MTVVSVYLDMKDKAILAIIVESPGRERFLHSYQAGMFDT